MEHEIYISGIGGQGIQIVAKVLALAAMAEQRYVMLNGFYGYEMRGGISLSTVAIGDRPLKVLPIAAQVGSAMVMHDHYWDKPMERLSPGALVFADRAIVDNLPDMPDMRVVSVDATGIAREVGSRMVTGMALLSAFNTATGLVRTESLIDAMKELVPPYRQQHVAANQRALELGAQAVERGAYRLELAQPVAELVA